MISISTSRSTGTFDIGWPIAAERCIDIRSLSVTVLSAIPDTIVTNTSSV